MILEGAYFVTAMRQAMFSLELPNIGKRSMKVSVSALSFQTPNITSCVLGPHCSCASYFPSGASFRSIHHISIDPRGSVSRPSSFHSLFQTLRLLFYCSTALHRFATHQSKLARELSGIPSTCLGHAESTFRRPS